MPHLPRLSERRRSGAAFGRSKLEEDRLLAKHVLREFISTRRLGSTRLKRVKIRAASKRKRRRGVDLDPAPPLVASNPNKSPAITDFRAEGTIIGPTGLTAVFGMGTGVTPPVSSPDMPATGLSTRRAPLSAHHSSND